MQTVQIRTVDGDFLLEKRQIGVMPIIGEEVVVGSDVYHTATLPSKMLDGEAIVYVSRLPGEA